MQHSGENTRTPGGRHPELPRGGIMHHGSDRFHHEKDPTMRRTVVILASLLASAVSPLPAAAQSSLDELERRLETLPGPSAKPREPGYLGLVADDALPGGGIRVTAVYDGSPAAATGIQPGDLILAIGGA